MNMNVRKGRTYENRASALVIRTGKQANSVTALVSEPQCCVETRSANVYSHKALRKVSRLI